MAAYQRRIILINKPFQIRFAIYVCSWLLVLGLIYPMLVSQIYDAFFRFLAVDPNGPMISTLQEAKRSVMFWLMSLQAFFVVITFMLSIFLSHRIAGPIYKLSKSFHEAASGSLKRITFRKSDHFKELAADFNVFVDVVADQISAAQTHLERASSATDAAAMKKEIEAAKAALSQFHR